MLTLSSSRRARIQARITALDAQITAMETAMENAVAKDVEEYTFNSGDGSQRAVNRDLDQMQKTLDNLYRIREHQHNILKGRGIMRATINRR
jgi:hypothetical protein